MGIPTRSDSMQKGLTVRVHSLLANHGGSIHRVDLKIPIRPDKEFFDDKFLHMMLLRLSTPVLWLNTPYVAYMAKPGLVPQAETRRGGPVTFVASGYENRSYDDEFLNWNNELMNMHRYQMRPEPCVGDYVGNIGQFHVFGNMTGSYAHCVCEVQRNKMPCGEKRTLMYPSGIDDGTGLFVAKTNILVGTSVARIPFKQNGSRWDIPVQPFFHMIYHTRDKIVDTMHKHIEDPYEDFEDFPGNDFGLFV